MGGDGAADIRNLDPGDFPGSQRAQPSTQRANGPTRVACSVKDKCGWACMATGEKGTFEEEEWSYELRARVGCNRLNEVPSRIDLASSQIPGICSRASELCLVHPWSTRMRTQPISTDASKLESLKHSKRTVCTRMSVSYLASLPRWRVTAPCLQIHNATLSADSYSQASPSRNHPQAPSTCFDNEQTFNEYPCSNE